MTKATRVSTKGIRQACDACHFKKIRCLRGPSDGDGACQKCNRERIECVFSPALKTGRPRKAAMEKRADAAPTCERSPGISGVENSPRSGFSDFQGPPSSAETAATTQDALDVSNLAFPSAECPLPLEGVLPDPANPGKPEIMVLGRLEQLSAFQRQLVAKRREHAALFSQRPGVDASRAIQEMLDITQKVTSFNTWLMNEGAKFAWRRPMLESMSDETALMMVVSPATLVLEVFTDILETAFPSLRAGSSESEAASSDYQEDSWVINPALLSNPPAEESYHATAVLPDVRAVKDLANPVCIYILLTALQEQLDAMRGAVDASLAAFPRMNSAMGAQGLLPAIMDQYLDKIRFVQAYITRAGGNGMMTGLD